MHKILGAKITKDSYNIEIKRISLGKVAISKLTKIMNYLGVSTNKKVKLDQKQSCQQYFRCKSCMLKKAYKNKTDVFETQTWRLLRIPQSPRMTSD